MPTKNLRRIASHEVLMTDGSLQTLSVVEIQSGVVAKCVPLTQELPFTEWLPGRIVLRRDEEGLTRAYYNNEIIN